MVARSAGALGAELFPTHSPRQGDAMATSSQKALSEGHQRSRAESFKSSLGHQGKPPVMTAKAALTGGFTF